MAINLVAHTLKQSTDTNGVTSSAINTTGASLLVMTVAKYSPGGALTISDNNGNTWTPLTISSSGNLNTLLYYSANPTVGSGHTFTASGSGVYVCIGVSAYSGVVTTSPFDVENGVSPGSFNNFLATGSVTPGADGELLVAAWGFQDTDLPDSPSVDSGFTLLDTVARATNGEGIVHAYFVQSTASAINPTCSWTNGANVYSARIAAFKATAGNSSILFAQSIF